MTNIDVRHDTEEFVEEGVTSSHDSDSNVVSSILQFRGIVVAARTFSSDNRDFLFVKGSFDQQSHDSVRVVSEFSSRSGSVTDLRVDQLGLVVGEDSQLRISLSDVIEFAFSEEFEVVFVVVLGDLAKQGVNTEASSNKGRANGNLFEVVHEVKESAHLCDSVEVYVY